MVKSYYDILGLPQNATDEQVRSRFRELARLKHPDRFPGAAKEQAEREFQVLTEAFNILTNADRRRLHDAELARPSAQSQISDPGQMARAFLQRGAKAYKDGNLIEAVANFDRATQVQPSNGKAWHHLALACSRERRWLSRGTTAIVKACELEPMNATYLKLAGRIFETADMPTRAEQYYTEALRWGGEDAGIQQVLEELQKQGRRGRSGLFG